MKYLFTFLFITFPLTGSGYFEDSERGREPGYEDTILHKTIRAAKQDQNDGGGDSP